MQSTIKELGGFRKGDFVSLTRRINGERDS
jgi:hypothetical protein